MTTSCCAGYNQFVKKHLPEIKEFVSDTKTPMYYTAEIVREKYPDSVIVFLSPCVAKRKEARKDPNVNNVMTYEELGALFIAKRIEIANCEEEKFEVESSKQARNFGISLGVAQAVQSILKDKDLAKPHVIDGLTKDTVKDLKKFAKLKKCDGDCNLVEVMCCEGGCIGGNSTINLPRIAKKELKTLLDQSSDLERK